MSSTDVVVSMRLYSPYRLFSQMKSTGSFHSAAMLSASWNAPMFAAPSPNIATAMSSEPAI
jgi:hypothetical protein